MGDVKKKLGNHHNTTKLTKLRKNIVPGSVLILLAGHFKGQRVVFFKKPKSAKKKNDETFFNDKESDKTLDESRKKVQADVDDKLVAQVSKDALLKAYLSSEFSLKNGDKPH